MDGEKFIFDVSIDLDIAFVKYCAQDDYDFIVHVEKVELLKEKKKGQSLIVLFSCDKYTLFKRVLMCDLIFKWMSNTLRFIK